MDVLIAILTGVIVGHLAGTITFIIALHLGWIDRFIEWLDGEFNDGKN